MANRPLVLVDFDQTITTIETTPLLGQAGLDFSNNPLSWSYFIDTYMKDYNDIVAKLPSTTTFQDRVQATREAELKSLARINDVQVFTGMTRKDITDAASRVASRYLQPGVLKTLEQPSRDGRLAVISVNWSKDWILAFLQPLGLTYNDIYCNDLLFKDGKATGEITPDILTSIDKMTTMTRMIEKRSPQQTVYIGDSTGDIFPLVNADIGIIMGNNKQLRESVSKYFDFSIDDGIRGSKKTRTLNRVDSWLEVEASGVLQGQ